MNFLLGAIIFDCIANSNEKSSESGFGILFSLGLVVYIIFNLKKIEQYILAIATNNLTLIGVITIGFFILIPAYWSEADKNKSILIKLILRIMLYMDFACGICLMVYFCNILGSQPASFVLNINTVAYYGQSKSFFVSLFASIAYLIIKLLDLLLVVGLIPLMQLLFALVIDRIFKNTK